MKRERFWMWLAWRMPKSLVYMCMIRGGAHATTGEYSHQVVPELEFMVALRRWSKSWWGWT